MRRLATSVSLSPTCSPIVQVVFAKVLRLNQDSIVLCDTAGPKRRSEIGRGGELNYLSLRYIPSEAVPVKFALQVNRMTENRSTSYNFVIEKSDFRVTD